MHTKNMLERKKHVLNNEIKKIQEISCTGRCIIIGDIHGCFEELLELLEKLKIEKSDTVISVGDFLDRGNNPSDCLDLWMKEKYYSVLGNHDKRYIDWYEGKEVSFQEKFSETINKLSKSSKYYTYLKSLPKIIRITNMNMVVVHAALDINYTNINKMIDNSISNILLRGRYIRKEMNNYKYLKLGEDIKTDCLWFNYYQNDSKIVYGHTPTENSEICIANNTYGIDTGCCYGKYLTALVIDKETITSVKVKSKKVYVTKTKKEDIEFI